MDQGLEDAAEAEHQGDRELWDVGQPRGENVRQRLDEDPDFYHCWR